MGRKNTKRAYIVNDARRNATYRERKNSVIKKTKEISTLCGVDACAIIYKPNEPEPEVWPSHSEVQNVLHKFSTIPPMVQRRNMLDQESFLKQRIKKAEDQLKKKRIQNRDERLSLLMINSLGNGRVEENINSQTSKDLVSMIERKLSEINLKMAKDQAQE